MDEFELEQERLLEKGRKLMQEYYGLLHGPFMTPEERRKVLDEYEKKQGNLEAEYIKLQTKRPQEMALL